ncbi:hypothetical protein [Paenibacillus daejeonensis]|uniref:hypothetical protein n=1 Tax=Paenibacillus daejeonensis TaxID=135193 RepID=UPI00036D3B88|nr:hypothetical protein [Paenibacillus daejeonensis]
MEAEIFSGNKIFRIEGEQFLIMDQDGALIDAVSLLEVQGPTAYSEDWDHLFVLVDGRELDPFHFGSGPDVERFVRAFHAQRQKMLH